MNLIQPLFQSFVRATVILKTAAILVFLLGGIVGLAEAQIYVDADAGGVNDGTSWDNAYTELADALQWANDEWDGSNPPLQIWVADGTYKPLYKVAEEDDAEEPTTKPDRAFLLTENVQIYGGFDPDNGIVNLSNDRILPSDDGEGTLLSGDLDGDDATDADGNIINYDENAYHVVIASGEVGSALLNGVTITGGYTTYNGTVPVVVNGNQISRQIGGGMFNFGSSPTLTNITFTGNGAYYGGGMANIGGSPELTNVTISGNGAIEDGGGMANSGGSPELTNVTFSGNRAGHGGGGMANFNDSSPTLTNVTFTGNRAYFEGGGMRNNDSSPTLINVSITGNSADGNGGGIYNFSGNAELVNVTIAGNSPNAIYAFGFTFWRNTIVYGGVDGDGFSASNSLIEGNSSTANGNIDATGLAAADIFSDPEGDDYSLLASSPAINAGSNSAYEEADGDAGNNSLQNDSDLAGEPRVFDDGNPDTEDLIDMGAYEFQGDPETPLILTMDEGWRMLSNPIDGQSYAGMLGPLWTQGIDGADYSGGDPNVYTWNIGYSGDCIEEYNNNQECDGWQVPSSTDFEDAIPAGTGFLVYVFADDEYGETEEEPFPKDLTLTGPRHNGQVSPEINQTGAGWTLVGNPYGRPIDFSEVINNTGTTGLTEAAYVYDPNATDINPPGPINGNGGAWRSIAGDFGDIPTGNIAPGQGFFVQTAEGASDPSLTFSPDNQTGGGEFYGKEKELRDFVRLELQGQSLYNSAWVRFSSEGALEPTTGEALELQPLDSNYALLGARKADGVLMDIAHYPLDTQELEIPLAIETTQSGSFTLRATDLDLPAGMALYLYDRQTGESMPITDTSFEYLFTVDAQTIPPYQSLSRPFGRGTEGGVPLAQNATPQQILAVGAIGPSKAKTTGEDRFLLTTSPGAPAGELPDEVALGQNYPNPFNPATVIRYQLPVSSEVRLEVYDMLGRRVATLVDGQVAGGRHQVNFDAGHLSSGIYLYRLSASGADGGNQIFTKKLTLIK